jgi:hypothetical protein
MVVFFGCNIKDGDLLLAACVRGTKSVQHFGTPIILLDPLCFCCYGRENKTPVPHSRLPGSATPLPSKLKMRQCRFWRQTPGGRQPTFYPWRLACVPPGDPTNWVRRTRESIFGIPMDAMPCIRLGRKE